MINRFVTVSIANTEHLKKRDSWNWSTDAFVCWCLDIVNVFSYVSRHGYVFSENVELFNLVGQMFRGCVCRCLGTTQHTPARTCMVVWSSYTSLLSGWLVGWRIDADWSWLIDQGINSDRLIYVYWFGSTDADWLILIDWFIFDWVIDWLW